MIEQDVLQATLERALRDGGDFAEVFVEDRRSSSARYDDGRVEELVSGRDRGAGLRVASGDTGMQTGYEAPGRTMGFELFDTVDPEDVGRAAATRALTLLDSVPAPTGRIPVVLRRGAGGVLFHEACGHGLEADHIYKDASVFSGDMGQRVASPLVTLVDDGTYGREWGTLAIDDEGYPTQRNVLIEDGVLTEYMWDLLRARKEGHPSSGNGRRESYKSLPMPRMT